MDRVSSSSISTQNAGQSTSGAPRIDSSETKAMETMKAKENEPPSEPDPEDESEDDEEILEESPCGRWIKRREEVKYRDVPGVDAAYLAMDTEEGVEVVWNEANFSETKKFKAQEDKLKKVFEALSSINHPNIVKFHRFWMDPGAEKDPIGDTGSSTRGGGNLVLQNVDSGSADGSVIEGASSKSGTDIPNSAIHHHHRTIEDKKKNSVSIKNPRLIFITEYMSSGSLKQFLRRTKKNSRKTQLLTWKRWCVQILSALKYLHITSKPPVVHGNLTCDTIFIQHNGLVKIGSIAPDIIYKNVKTCRDNIKNLHFLAPEYGDSNHVNLTTAMDIYALGMAALEMSSLEIQVNEDSSGVVTDEAIEKTINSLEDEFQKDFIRKCIKQNPNERPTAHELLFHPVLFEVHSCKLLAAHQITNLPSHITESMNEKAFEAMYANHNVLATLNKGGHIIEFRLQDVSATEKLEKYIEDVKNGIYPITAYGNLSDHNLKEEPSMSSDLSLKSDNCEESKISTPPEFEPEMRRCSGAHATLYSCVDPKTFYLSLLIKLEDSMNRQLYCPISSTDSPNSLVHELIYNAFINKADSQLLEECLDDCFKKFFSELLINESGSEEVAEVKDRPKLKLNLFNFSSENTEQPMSPATHLEGVHS